MIAPNQNSDRARAALNSSDPQVQRALEIGRKTIDTELPLLILGETGTGKDTLARALQASSARRKSPEDGRLVLVELTARGRRLITRLFPQLNSEETLATRLLPPGRKEDTAELLRLMVLAGSDIDS